nr:transmembrane protease serine 11A-like [Onthophagus taurus]
MILTFLLTTLYFVESTVGKSKNDSARIAKTRIVGGFNCISEAYPYLVTLYVDKTVWCQGSLLSSKIVLTSAHCCAKDDISIEAGSTFARSKMVQTSRVLNSIKHPNYTRKGGVRHDVCVIHLASPIRENEAVSYLKLANTIIYEKMMKEGKCNLSLVLGFGYQGIKYMDGRSAKVNVPYNKQLQCLYVTPISDLECGFFYSKGINMLCAKDARNTMQGDACHGDSGGPVVCKNIQIGIVTAGWGCGIGAPSLENKICAGTLIHSNYVLSSAHCCLNDDIVVSTNKKITNVIRQHYKYHNSNEKYDHALKGYDVCVMQLGQRMDDVKTKLVDLVTPTMWQKMVKENQIKNCLILGFDTLSLKFRSKTKKDKENHSNYRCGNVSVIENRRCPNIDQWTICAYELTNGTSDFCREDAGGPLMCDGVQIGILSFGIFCGQSPGVYTRVDTHIDFIKSIIDNDSLSKSSYIKINLILAGEITPVRSGGENIPWAMRREASLHSLFRRNKAETTNGAQGGGREG